jgi:hypothetical protein
MAFYLLSPFVGVVIVICSIPADCWRTVRQNCRRQDGSFSHDRATRELKLFSDHVLTLTTLSLLAVLACFALGTVVASCWLPTEVVIEAVVRFQPNPTEWKAGLADVREAHSDFLMMGQGWSVEQATEFQKDLWHARASVALISCVSLLTALLVLIRIIGHGTAKFAWGIRMRRRVYARRDVDSMRSSPVAAPKPSVTEV